MRRFLCVGLGVTALAACKDKPPAAPVSAATSAENKAAFAPLEPEVASPATGDAGDAEREALFVVAPFEPRGPSVPSDAQVVELTGLSDARATAKKVLLVARGETYLAEVTPLLAALDDAGAEVWIKHPEADLAFPVDLEDEAHFQAWLDEARPGKVRVVHRSDGFELQSNMGKLSGADPNGPSVPVRGGKMDLKTLQKGLVRLKGRFKGDAPEIFFVPSYGLELNRAFRAVSANWLDADKTVFGEVRFLYPRPKPMDAGAR